MPRVSHRSLRHDRRRRHCPADCAAIACGQHVRAISVLRQISNEKYMSKYGIHLIRLVVFLVSIAVLNLLFGVFGLNWAIATLVVFIVFAIYSSFVTQPEDKEPHA